MNNAACPSSVVVGCLKQTPARLKRHTAPPTTTTDDDTDERRQR
jgi:hypothetical protein